MIGTFVSLNFELRNLKLSKLQVAKVQNQKNQLHPSCWLLTVSKFVNVWIAHAQAQAQAKSIHLTEISLTLTLINLPLAT